MKKWTIDWLNTYSEVMISEELPSGIIMKKHFLKNPDEPNFWTKYFSTNSQLPFCPYHGDFRQCAACEWYNGEYCENCLEEYNLFEVFAETLDAKKAGDYILLI